MNKLLALSIIGLSFLACNKKTSSKTKEEKPNIIFILTDDQRWDALGYTGNALAHTPEMDKLAKSGVFFKNTIATTPICAASRASIFSGLQERTHNYSFTSKAMKDEYMEQAFPRVLKQSGYYTGLYGKFGVKYKKLDSLYDVHENYDLRYDRKDITSYYYKTLGKDTVHLTRYTGEKALQFLDKAPTDKPFCLQLSFSAPHASDNTVEQYFWQEENNHVLENVTMPDANISSDEDYNKLPQLVKDGFNRLRWYWRYDTPEKYQHSVKGYFRMLAGIDNEIAKIRTKLEAKGIADNTIIVLMGDNGFFLGERQISGKWLMYDNSLKVPLIIYDPRNKAHKDVEQMALNIDVPSTILDFAGVEAPKSWHGKSLKPFINEKNVNLERDTILIEHLWDFKNIAPSEGVRTQEWKYFRYVDDKSIEELYNLKEDPRETNNLIHNEQYQDVLNNLRAKCEDLIEKYKDPYALIIENNTFDGKAFRWIVSKDSKKQSAYQILLASSQENINKNIADVWNSTKIKGNTKEVVKPKALKLEKGKTYYWKMRIYDELNRTGAYTKAQKITN
ncbi:sulfatase [uncultured Polaribacter sp.]|uniref:sulfatase family protein n=1 Tax=uncultured Polaribacter sp. TaxID=174711 RepID=UPI00259B8BC9|nr:sulfatase [uncultured Polaribacter sp.]